LQLAREFIPAGREQGQKVSPILVAGHFVSHPGIDVPGHDGCADDDGTAVVRDGAGNLGLCLRSGDGEEHEEEGWDGEAYLP
jgi:hypothetical protein